MSWAYSVCRPNETQTLKSSILTSSLSAATSKTLIHSLTSSWISSPLSPSFPFISTLLLPSFPFLLALLLRLELVIYLPEPQVLWFWKDTRAWSSQEIVRIGSVRLSPVWECRALSQEGQVLISERLFFTSVLEFASLLLWAFVLWICWLTLCHLLRSLLSLAQSLTFLQILSQSFNVF